MREEGKAIRDTPPFQEPPGLQVQMPAFQRRGIYPGSVGKCKGPSVGSASPPVQGGGHLDGQPVTQATWVCTRWVCDSTDMNEPGTLSQLRWT